MKSTIQEEQKSEILNNLRNETLSVDMTVDIDEDRIQEITSGSKIPGSEVPEETPEEDPEKASEEAPEETPEETPEEDSEENSAENESDTAPSAQGEDGEPEDDTPVTVSPEPTLFEERTTEETTTETGTPEAVPGWNKSGYIAVGALLAAIFLIVFRIMTSKKHSSSGKKGQGKKRSQAFSDEKTTGMETEGASSFEPVHTEKQAAPAGTKAPYSVAKVHSIGARKDQQDSYNISDYMDSSLLREKGFLAIVADGMGGLSNGGMVSKLAVNTGLEYFYGASSSLTPERRLLEMAQIINIRVNQLLHGRKERSGSTLVEALIYQNKLYFLTIGDSRIYLYRGGHMICLNRPHIYAEELALEGVNQQRSLSDMDSDRQKASLTSYLGAGRLKHLDRNAEGITLVKGDKIMLCSDGVFGTLNEESMELALSKNPEEAAELLEQQVYVAGKSAQDNFTAVIIQCN